ncbi:MAG: COX15/CtaA family protein [Flavobacteriales bacterium]|nr:COX15/CtaA family protein [Flavobacteriales bacterium]
MRYFSFILIGLLWCQIILGGTVASHYAALACPDFPLCQGQFIPTLSGAVGLNVLHRLGAYACVIYIMGFYWAVSVYVPKEFKIVKKWTKRLAIGIWLQVALGISNVLFVTPPLIVVLHLTLGTILFGISLRIAYLISYGEAQAGNELYASNTALTGN